jgi:hypothetical protein
VNDLKQDSMLFVPWGGEDLMLFVPLWKMMWWLSENREKSCSRIVAVLLYSYIWFHKYMQALMKI